MKNPVDAFFAQIQGSTRVKLDDGELLRLNYIASNGKPYTPVGKFLVDQGLCIARRHVDGPHPRLDGRQSGRRQRPAAKNRSFVFFPKTRIVANDETPRRAGRPADAAALAGGRQEVHVYGTPIWIDAELPINQRSAA